MALNTGFTSPTSAQSLVGFILIDRFKNETFEISNISASGGTCLLTPYKSGGKPYRIATYKIARYCKSGACRLFPLS